jgi:hypothetical protein
MIEVIWWKAVIITGLIIALAFLAGYVEGQEKERKKRDEWI